MGQIRANKQVATLFEGLPLSTKGKDAKNKAQARSIPFTLLLSIVVLTKYVESPTKQIESKDDARTWIVGNRNPICSKTASNPSNTHACSHRRIHEHVTITHTRTYIYAVSSSACDFLYVIC